MDIYILKFSACLAVFMFFYKFVLEKETIHHFKRFYLLAALLVSVGIPFITFTTFVEAESIMNTAVFTNSESAAITAEIAPTFLDYLPTILWSVYFLGVLIFVGRFTINLVQLIKRIKKNPKYKKGNLVHVLMTDLIYPHTFLQYIFLNKLKYESHDIPKEVMLHEETHAKQKHALDILCIELMQIIFWFNPLLYFIKKDIKLNHEFLADQAVLESGTDTKTYQHILLAFSASSAMEDAQTNHLANAINYSLIKKRFTVMKSHTSNTVKWVKGLIILPILAVLIYSFSGRKEVTTDIFSDTEISEETSSYLPQQSQSKKASIEKHVYYQYVTFIYIDKDGNELKKSYSELTETEIQNLMPPPETPKKSPPTQTELSNWKDSKTFGVWVDGTRIENAKLNTFSSNDFALFYLSKLEKNAKNYGKHYYQVNVYTHDKYNELYKNGIKPLSRNTIIKINQHTVSHQNSTQIAKTSQTKLLLKIYDVICEDCRFSFDKELIKNLKIETNTTETISSFKFKVPGKPTVNVVGNGLNEEALTNLNYAKIGDYITIYDIKASKNSIKTPILIELQANLIPPPPPPIPASATPEQQEKYKKVQDEYNQKYKVKKGGVSNIPPPPPPPIPASATPEQQEKYKQAQEDYQKKYKVTKGEVSITPPPPPPAPKTMASDKKTDGNTKTGFTTINNEKHFYATVEGKTKYYNRWGNEVDKSGKIISSPQTNGDDVVPDQKISKVYQNDQVVSEFNKNWVSDTETLNPPPPPPISPLDHVIKMAKKDAIFFYEGKSVSSDRAIALLKSNRELNILTKNTDSNIPRVFITKDPINHDTISKTSFPKPTAENAVSHLKVMNRHGAKFYLDGKEVLFDDALKAVRKNKNADINSTMEPPVVKISTKLIGVMGKK